MSHVEPRRVCPQFLAEVELQPWTPSFETTHRRLVPVADLLDHLAVNEEGFLPTYRRAMIEAGLA